MKGYFVEDIQFPYGGGWLAPENWGLFKSVKDIKQVILAYGDFHNTCEESESVCEANACAKAQLPVHILMDIWDFRIHRATPSQLSRFGYKPSELVGNL